MPVATDPPPPLKPSRYRTIRGKNVPESRRYVEPAPTQNAASTAAAGREPDEMLASVSPRPGDAVRRPAPAPSAPPVPPLQPSSTAAATAAPVAATPARPRHRPPPLRSPRPDDAQFMPWSGADREATPEAGTTAPPLPTPMLVPLPSARARGVAAESELHGEGLGADEVARRDAEAERLLAEQKRKDLERLQRELANHQPAPLPPKSPSRDKFSFLTRRRGLSSAAPPSSALRESPTEPLPNSPISPASSSSRTTTSYTSRTHSGSEPPLPPNVSIDARAAQQMDVPSSAPGSGANRQAVVRCGQFSATVPVSPESTVTDVLEACAGLFPGSFSPASSALIESYTRLGLERRLRRYERIRDVMNSWDSDADNAFVIMPSDADEVAAGATPGVVREKKGILARSGHGDNGSSSIIRRGHASDLDLSSVSRSRSTPPQGFSFMQMYHSQKPGRWSKRYITLVEETGQMVASKKADESRLAFLSSEGGSTSNKNSNGDFQNLCHLSDYDIYTPTETQMRKNLRPPKTYCFAIKSQQRTTVFVNTENYVHFFSTDDPALARMFYDRVFAWRSWYLVNRQLSLPVRTATKKKQEQGQPQQQQQPVAQPPQPAPMPPSSSSALKKNAIQRSLSRKMASNAPIEKSRHSTAESLFGGVGNFDPTLDLERFEKPAAPDTSTRAMRVDGERSAFASNGLLGNAYDERKKAEAGKQHESATQISSAVTPRDAAFTGGSSLLGNNATASRDQQTSSGPFRGTASGTTAAAVVSGGADSATWFPSASEYSARQRSKSIRETPSSSRPPSGEDIPLGLQYPQLIQQQQPHHQADRDAAVGRSRSIRRTNAHIPPSQQQQLLNLQQQHPPLPPHMPAPLVDLTPKFQEPPQWSKEGRGHGVRAPPGTTHLVDLATDSKARLEGGGSNSLVGQAPSNAGFLRRGELTASQAAAHQSSRRSQTMTSSSASVAAGFSRSRSVAHHSSRGGEAPPVPLLSRIPQNPTSTHEGVLSGRERSTTLTRNK